MAMGIREGRRWKGLISAPLRDCQVEKHYYTTAAKKSRGRFGRGVARDLITVCVKILLIRFGDTIFKFWREITLRADV